MVLSFSPILLVFLGSYFWLLLPTFSGTNQVLHRMLDHLLLFFCLLHFLFHLPAFLWIYQWYCFSLPPPHPAQSDKCGFSMSIISSELIHRSLLYFIWFLCCAVNLSPRELCLTDYVLTYDINFLKNMIWRHWYLLPFTTSFHPDWLYVHDKDVNDGKESARPGLGRPN